MQCLSPDAQGKDNHNQDGQCQPIPDENIEVMLG
jgi:hypothetical protein